jgi:hypothetical protein
MAISGGMTNKWDMLEPREGQIGGGNHPETTTGTEVDERD